MSLENSDDEISGKLAKVQTSAEEVEDPMNTRGIPGAEFIDDPIAHLKTFDGNCESALKKQNELYGKYKFLESSLIQQRAVAEAKLPEIKKTLSMIQKLVQAQELDKILNTQYLLSDNCYAKAAVKPDDKVCLWLGANTMVEYSYEEALSMLTEQAANTEQKIEDMRDDCLFLKDQITTTEVNIARVYNADVRSRKAQAAE